MLNSTEICGNLGISIRFKYSRFLNFFCKQNWIPASVYASEKMCTRTLLNWWPDVLLVKTNTVPKRGGDKKLVSTGHELLGSKSIVNPHHANNFSSCCLQQINLYKSSTIEISLENMDFYFPELFQHRLII